MPKNKRNNLQQRLVEFLRPTKLKILIIVPLYFSYLISFFGLIFNFPIYYLFYWDKPVPTGLYGMMVFVTHLAYLYLLSCLLARLLRN